MQKLSSLTLTSELKPHFQNVVNLNEGPLNALTTPYSDFKRIGISDFSLCIILNNGQKYMINENSDEIVQIELALNGLALNGGECPKEVDNNLIHLLKDCFANQFSYFPNHFMICEHSECTFIFSGVRYENQAKVAQFVKYDNQQFQRYCIDFTDKFLERLIEINPTYRFYLIFTNKLLRDSVINNTFSREIGLSNRERQCLLMISQGKQTKEIAKELDISPYTVEVYIKNIKRKLNCKTLPEVITEAMQRGIIGGFTRENKFTMPLANHFYIAKSLKNQLMNPLMHSVY